MVRSTVGGAGSLGQLGNGATDDQPSPVAVLPGENTDEKEYVQITAGNSHTCGITSDGKAYCWGTGSTGRLGNGATDNQSTPVAVLPGENTDEREYVQIATGGYHTCGLTSDGKAYCWGLGGGGMLGNGDTSSHSTPVAVLPGENTARSCVSPLPKRARHTGLIRRTGDPAAPPALSRRSQW